jgi:hypothetical protein
MAEGLDKTSYYHTLDRNRRRAEELAFSLNRIPVDNDHEAFIRQQEKEEKERPAQQEFARNVCSPSPGEKDKRPLHSEFQNNRSISGSTVSTQPDLMDLRSGDDESSICCSEGDSRGEILPKNMRRILLLFENKKQFKCDVLLDSGATGNWISEGTVRENSIPWDSDEEDEERQIEYEDVNGRTVKSRGIVHAQWIFRGQTREAKFNIMRGSNTSWQVIFGCHCLLRNDFITFHHDKADGLVAPIVQKTRKPTQSKPFHSAVCSLPVITKC